MNERHSEVLALTEERWREFVHDQLLEGELRFEAHQAALAENTALTQKVVDSTAEIVEAFSATKKGVHFFSAVGHWLNRFARWVAPILTLAGIIWALAHGHTLPKGGE